MKISKPGTIVVIAGCALTFLGSITPFYSILGIGVSLMSISAICGLLNLIVAGVAVFLAFRGAKMVAAIASGVAGVWVLLAWLINREGKLSSSTGIGYYINILAGLALIVGGVVLYLKGVEAGEGGINPFAQFGGQNPFQAQQQNPFQYQDPNQYQNPGQYQDQSQNQNPSQYQNIELDQNTNQDM